jgi:hypothetical protein
MVAILTVGLTNLTSLTSLQKTVSHSKEEHKLRVPEDGALREMFGPNRGGGE